MVHELKLIATDDITRSDGPMPDGLYAWADAFGSHIIDGMYYDDWGLEDIVRAYLDDALEILRSDPEADEEAGISYREGD